MVPVMLGPMIASPIAGQTLREAFEELYVFGQCGQPVCLDVSASVHGNHFSTVAQQAGTSMIGFVLQSIGSSLASIPIPSSNAAEVFYFEGGVLQSTRSSAGPVFMERSQTLGQGNLLLGVNVGRTSPSNIRGQSLEDLSLRFTHEDVGTAGLGDPDWENDEIRVTTDLGLEFTVGSVFLAYGLSSSVDIGLAVPVVSASLQGTSAAQIVPFEGSGSPHAFLVDGQQTLTASSSADRSATGLGDVTLRAKANLHQSETLGFAALAEVRLPTGDEDNFHGTGETTARLMGVLSRRSETVSPHLNAGFTLRTGEESASSVTVRGGLDAMLGPSVTGSLELLGDLLIQDTDSDQAVTRAVDYQFPVARTLRVSDIPAMQDHVLDLVGGLKVQPSPSFRIVGSVLVPLREGGVRPDVQWTLGLERVF
jgi:hypothetical protein